LRHGQGGGHRWRGSTRSLESEGPDGHGQDTQQIDQEVLIDGNERSITMLVNAEDLDGCACGRLSNMLVVDGNDQPGVS
jgi:hypothetical protein